MRLFELFDKTYDYAWVEPGADYATYAAAFDIASDETVKVLFVGAGKGIDAYEVAFHREGDNTLTGGGDAIKIYSTFLEIVKDFIHKHSPGILYYSASKTELSRIKFYKRMSSRIFVKQLGYVDVTKDLSELDDTAAQYFAAEIKNAPKFETTVLANPFYLKQVKGKS